MTSFNFSSDLLVEWNSLPQQYANGKLLGYTIYYQDYNIFWSPYKSVNTSSPSATRFTLKGLKPANEYLVAVAAFTSKGEGPWSAHEYAVTGTFLNDSQGTQMLYINKDKYTVIYLCFCVFLSLEGI